MLIQIIGWQLPPGVRTNKLLATAQLHREHAWPTPCADHKAELQRRESSTYDQSEVGVLCIMPHDDRWGVITDTVALSGVDGGDHGDIEGILCDDIEKALVHIPNLEQLDDFRGDFRWRHRTLVKVRNLEAGKKDGVERADYLMYVCLDENSAVRVTVILRSLCLGLSMYMGAPSFSRRQQSRVNGMTQIRRCISMTGIDLTSLTSG